MSNEEKKLKALEVENKKLIMQLAEKGVIIEQLRTDNDNIRNKVFQLEEEIRKLKDRIEKLEKGLRVLTQEKNRRQLLDYVADLGRLFFLYKGGSWNEITEKISVNKARLEDNEIDMQTYISVLDEFHPILKSKDLDTLHSILTSRNSIAHQEIRSVFSQQNFITKLNNDPWHEFAPEEKRVVFLMLFNLKEQKLILIQ